MSPKRPKTIAVVAAAVVLALVAGAVALALARGGDDPAAAVGDERGSPPSVGAPGGGAEPGGGAAPAVDRPTGLSYPIVSPEPQPGEEPERGVTVTGTAIVEARPDRSRWSFGVQAEGETARQAFDRASEAANRLVAALKREGVAERDLRTEQVSVWPSYDGGRGVSGYVASTSVHTLVRSLDRASRIVDAAVEAGANQVSGPGLENADRDALYRQALAAALDQARANAEALAKRAGAQLGPAIAIRESGSVSPPVIAEAAAAADASGRAMPIEPGRQEISATVTVTFALAGSS